MRVLESFEMMAEHIFLLKVKLFQRLEFLFLFSLFLHDVCTGFFPPRLHYFISLFSRLSLSGENGVEIGKGRRGEVHLPSSELPAS